MIWIKLGWKLGNHWLFPDEKEVHSFLENKFYCHIIAQFFVLRNLDSEVFQFGDKTFTGLTWPFLGIKSDSNKKSLM